MQIFGQNISTLLKYHYKYVKFRVLTYIVSKKVVELTGFEPVSERGSNTLSTCLSSLWFSSSCAAPNITLSIMKSIITEI